jgi:membrane-bound ClpP family serine protease
VVTTGYLKVFTATASRISYAAFVWRAYERNIPNSLIGSTGVAVDQLSPSGYVRINGELWRARVIENDSTIEKGETVVVKGVDGLTLTVIPFTSSSPLF